MPVALEVNHVWKKFFRGEFNDSLRDAISALCKSLVGLGPSREELQKGDFWSLKDVDFKVEEGETVALIGHNGAGKSTMLKILSKILKPNRGSIKANGKLRALIEVGSGFHGDLTGRENIFLNGSILGMTHKEIQSKFDEIVDFSGIEEFLDMPVKRYSSGMFARLGFAVAAHMEPDILIVDEVLSVGDIEFQKKCFGKMNSVASEGRTVLFVSHNIAAVRNLCKRTILLNQGEIVNDGPTNESLEAYFQLLKKQRQSWGEITSQANPNPSVLINSVTSGPSIKELSKDAIGLCSEPFYVRVAYQLIKAIENATITVSFVNAEGVYTSSISTQFTHKSIGTLEKSGYIDFYIPSLNLSKGDYTLVAQIHNKGTPGKERKCYAQVIDAGTLKISNINTVKWNLGEGYAWYPFFMPYEWEIH